MAAPRVKRRPDPVRAAWRGASAFPPARRVATALVLAVLATTVVLAQKPLNDPPTDLQTSECYTCHAQGGGSFGPPLRQMYSITMPANRSIPVNEPFDFPVAVRNTWTAELQDLAGTLDLSRAPSMGFAGDRDPTTAHETGTLSGIATDERSARFTFAVPAGASDIGWALRPTTDQAVWLPPDLVLRMWPADVDPATVAGSDTDRAGAGGTESFRVKGPAAVAAAGAGNWTVDVVQPVVRDGVAALLPQDFRLSFFAFYNTTGARAMPLGSPDTLDGQAPQTRQETTFTWRLRADRPPDPGERITVVVNATAHYAHPGTTSGGRDDWRFTDTRTVAIGAGIQPVGPGGPSPTTGPGPTGPTSDDAIPWDRIGEAVGYVSAFLLVFSMVTGGVFGKATRRWQNHIFRSAKRRVAFHNFVSYLLTFFAAAHTALFLWEPGFPWTLGMIWGTGGLLAMTLLGVTGALQVPMIRRWNFATWRWTHFWLGIAAVVLTVVHMLLDGANFTEVAAWVGWDDPLR